MFTPYRQNRSTPGRIAAVAFAGCVSFALLQSVVSMFDGAVATQLARAERAAVLFAAAR